MNELEEYMYITWIIWSYPWKTEHQSELNSATSWTPSLWKTSLNCTTLKTVMPFLPTSWLQSCVRETAEGLGEHHAPHAAPLPTLPPQPWENNTAQPMGRLNEPSSPAKLKIINTELYSNTAIRGGGGMLNPPQRMGMGQGAKLSALNTQGLMHKAAKAESRAG
jgi:hypothetical protein